MKKLILLAVFIFASCQDDDMGRNCSCDIITNIENQGEIGIDLLSLRNECTAREWQIMIVNEHFRVGDCVRF